MGNGTDNGNDLGPAEQRDAPGSEAAPEAQRSWVTAVLSEAHQVGDVLLDAAALYGAKKALDKFRKPPPPPSPPPPPTAATPPPSDSK
jgi:hypothetical protein